MTSKRSCCPLPVVVAVLLASMLVAGVHSTRTLQQQTAPPQTQPWSLAAAIESAAGQLTAALAFAQLQAQQILQTATTAAGVFSPMQQAVPDSMGAAGFSASEQAPLGGTFPAAPGQAPQPIMSSSFPVSFTFPRPLQTPTFAAPAPAPAPAPTPAAPAAPRSTAFACSATDVSASAVFSCINAVRTNPDAFQSKFPCAYASFRPSLLVGGSPARPALRSNTRLTNSAQRQAEGMASMQAVTHTGKDGTTFDQRIAQAGYSTFPQAENVAGGQTSALQVVMQWMCSSGHRSNIMSCSLDEVGTGVATSGSWVYYAQDFGCSITNKCSC